MAVLTLGCSAGILGMGHHSQLCPGARVMAQSSQHVLLPLCLSITTPGWHLAWIFPPERDRVHLAPGAAALLGATQASVPCPEPWK